MLAEHGPLGPVWWRYGRPGRHYLTEALDNPDNRAAYDRRQAAPDGGEQFGGGRVLLGGRSRACRRASRRPPCRPGPLAAAGGSTGAVAGLVPCGGGAARRPGA
ncbi:hypothetical protein ACFV61_35800, partial [Kitasatospora sp. NPDC059817]